MSFPIFNKTYYSIMESFSEKWKEMRQYTPMIKEIGSLSEEEAIEKIKTLSPDLKNKFSQILGLDIHDFDTTIVQGKRVNNFYNQARRFYLNTGL